MRKLLFIAIIGLGIVSAVVWAVFFRLPVRAYSPVVAAINNGTITIPAGGGTLKLPASLRGITPRDEVIAARRPDGRIFVLFPTWYGRGNDLQGSLYCSGPLKATDYYSINWGSGGVPEHIDVADRKLLTVERQDSPWYFITRRLD